MSRAPGILTAGRIAEITGGELSGSAEVRIQRGRADSRLCRPGDLYVALPGERTDGNLYVEAAWEAGADAAMADSSAEIPPPPGGKALVRVGDPMKALHAAARRLRNDNPELMVVGITGSNGKTTTKDILASILGQSRDGKILVTEGNYNSDIGLPLTLLGLRNTHEIAVLEMGMNRPGEMALLASIARPRIAVITNIGSAHVGMLGSREQVAAEKRRILDGADSESVAVVGANEPWADFLLESFPGSVRRFGIWGRDSWDSYSNKDLEGFILKRRGRAIRFHLPGVHNLMNAMAATEAALALGVPEDDIAAGLESVRPTGGRSEVVHGAVTVIRDSYNANPESLQAAFNLFANTSAEGRRVLVLGELLELGDETDQALEAAGGAAADLRPDAVFLFGESLEPLMMAARNAGYSGKAEVFREMNRLRDALSEYLRPGDLVLLKGSRGSALERLDEAIAGLGVG